MGLISGELTFNWLKLEGGQSAPGLALLQQRRQA
jgi:hypothetical protein